MPLVEFLILNQRVQQDANFAIVKHDQIHPIDANDQYNVKANFGYRVHPNAVALYLTLALAN
ncbi:MAG: hypothetical protein CO158_04390 [Piscirickettsiaceae bacterium CG_4_9_14_3_um_filter_43_564]|nr:MAG: hypothetical protein CO158_04390 [Piscirickettsiaceae bacterium CG_4_9_14_3_um_filter_43_564]